MYQVLSEKGFNFIKNSRRCCLSSYKDEMGSWAIGYGYKENVGPGRTISELTALSLLQSDIMECEKKLNSIIMTPLAQNQFDAVLSLFYDVGPGILGKKSGVEIYKSGNTSPILSLINEARFDAAGEYFSCWGMNHCKDKQHFREAEKKIFLYGTYPL